MRFALLICLLLSSPCLFGQGSYTLSAEVSADEETIDFAEVLLTPRDQPEDYRYTSIENGTFVLEEIEAGNYELKIFALAYEEYQEELEIKSDLRLQINMKRSEAIALEEVSVVEKKPMFSNESGDLKVNVAASLLAAEGTPIDILQKIPGLQVNSTGDAVTIIGKGNPLLYIGNRRISLDYFRSLAVADIQSIQIINNPSVKYEAEGRAVLMISLKKNREDGYQANLSERISKKFGWNNYLAAGTTFKKNKIELKANLGFNTQEPWEQLSSEFAVPTKNLSTAYTTTATGERNVYLLGGGLFYAFNDSDYFSLNTTTRLRRGEGNIITNTKFSSPEENTQVETLNEQTDYRDFINTNFNYNKKTKKGNLFFGAQNINYLQKADTDISNNFNNTGTVPTQERVQDFRVSSRAARLDYELNINDKTKWEGGLNAVYTLANSSIQVADSQDTENDLDTDYQNSERNLAGYIQIAGALGKVQISGGVRVENVRVRGAFADAPSNELSRDNTFLFPKARVHLPIDSTRNLTFNYGRSINRPRFSQTGQIALYANPFTVITNNTGLLPVLSDEVSTVFQFGRNSLAATYVHRKNPYLFNTRYDEEEEIYILSPRNFARENSFTLNLTLPFEHKIWSSANSVTLLYATISDPAAVLRPSTPYYYIYSSQNLRLPKNFTFNLTAFTIGNRQEGIFDRRGFISVNLGLQKSFNKHWNLSFAWNDIFNGLRFSEESEVSGLVSLTAFETDVRELALGLRYNFGAVKSTFKNKDVFEESGRIR